MEKQNLSSSSFEIYPSSFTKKKTYLSFFVKDSNDIFSNKNLFDKYVKGKHVLYNNVGTKVLKNSNGFVDNSTFIRK